MRQFLESEQELLGYFTSALGVSAQGYESFGAKEYSSTDALATMFFSRPRLDEIALSNAVEATLAVVGSDSARALRLTFHPARIGSGPYQVGLGRLAAMGIQSASARSFFSAWSERAERKTTCLVQWLDDEATRPSSRRCHDAIRTETEGRLHRALTSYDAARVERVKREKTAKRAKREKSDAAVARARGDVVRGWVKTPKERPSVVSLSAAIAQCLAWAAEDEADSWQPMEEAS